MLLRTTVLLLISLVATVIATDKSGRPPTPGHLPPSYERKRIATEKQMKDDGNDSDEAKQYAYRYALRLYEEQKKRMNDRRAAYRVKCLTEGYAQPWANSTRQAVLEKELLAKQAGLSPQQARRQAKAKVESHRRRQRKTNRESHARRRARQKQQRQQEGGQQESNTAAQETSTTDESAAAYDVQHAALQRNPKTPTRKRLGFAPP